MYGNIYCLTFQGNLVSDDIRDALFSAGYLMIVGHEKRHRIKTDECEGIVRTAFQHQGLVDIYGVVFVAELETEKGKLTVTYIVRDRDLGEMEQMEEGAWVSVDDLDEEIPAERIRPSPLKRLKKHFINN